MPHRKYDEHEIARVIERAAELQEADAERARRTERGLTLEELERVGAETGLDPAYIRAAAAEADAPGPRERSWQSTTHVHAERWVPGPLQPEAWEETVAALRRYAPGMTGWEAGGRTERVGRSREWTGRTSLGLEVRATVSPRSGGQRVRVQQHVGYGSERVEAVFMVGPFFALFGFFVAAVLTDSPADGLAWALPVYVLAAALSYVGDRAWRRSKQRDLDDLAGEIESAVRAANDERGWGADEPAHLVTDPEAEAHAEPPHLDLDALAGADAPPPSNRRRAPVR